MLGSAFFHFEIEALFLIGELAGAVAVAFELGEGGFDFCLHGGDERLRAVRFGARGAQRIFESLAFGACSARAFLHFGETQFLFGDVAVELVERFVGGDEIEFLLGELVAGRLNVLAVLADAGLEFVFAFLVEGHASFGAVERVAVFVEALADFGEFAFEDAGGGAGFVHCFLFCGELHREFRVTDFEPADRGEQLIAFGGELDEFSMAEVRVEYAGVGGECLIAAGFRDLALERVHAALLFGEHIRNAQQVGFGVFEFAQRFLFLALELRDAGGFFEHRAAFLGF